jgi:hydrogenase maturation protease
MSPNAGVLVVGYGNALRGDDGLGWHAAARLAADPRLAGAEVLARHQLTPELAEEISQAALAVLVDARDDGGPPGQVTVRRVAPAARAVPAWSHRLDPATLVGLAGALYGSLPPVFLVSAGVARCEAGERLSPALERALPRVVDAVARIVAERSGA